MGKKRLIIIGILAACLVVGLAFQFFHPGTPEYQGKSLNTWLKRLENWDGDTNNAAFLAFQKMGTNAIPALLDVIQSGGTPFQKMILKFNRKQSLIQLPYGKPWIQDMAATWALYAMGTNAAPAIPVLTNLLFHSNALVSSTTVLAGIGPEALPALMTALTNQNYFIRHSAASGLGWERSDASIIVPALIARLQDRNRLVHMGAASSLGQLHAQAELVVPALIKDFPSDDPLLRLRILNSLAQFEGKARDSVPFLVETLKDGDESVRIRAALALKQIDPEAAAKAGVK